MINIKKVRESMADPNKGKNYHVSKREKDGKWQVKIAGSDKIIKTFATKAEAMEYVEKIAENQDRSIIVHPSKGKNKGKFSSR